MEGHGRAAAKAIAEETRMVLLKYSTAVVTAKVKARFPETARRNDA